MSSKTKDKVRASAKPTNKDHPSKPSKASSARDSHALADYFPDPDDGPLPPPPTEHSAFAHDGRRVKASIPVDEPTAPVADADDGDKVSLADLDRAKRNSAKAGKKQKGAKQGTAAEVAAEPIPTKQPKPKTAKPPKQKKVSGLDAAAMVLAGSGAPMKAIDILAEIQKRGLWTSNGRTPEATLYAAMIREIAAKGSESRFRKHDRGLFVAAGKGE